MPKTLETDLERLERKRKQGRIRAKRFRDRAEERANSKIAEALTKLTNPDATLPGPESSLADRTASALLDAACRRYGLDLDGMVKPVAEGLQAQRVRRVGRKTALTPDWASRLRASEQARGIFEALGQVPSRRQAEPVTPIVVQILMMPDSDAEMKTIEVEEIAAQPSVTPYVTLRVRREP